MKTKIHIDNLKCGGCATSVKTGLLSIAGVNEVSVDLEDGVVEIEAINDSIVKEAKQKLLSMGYPETGTLEGIKKVTANAKSYVSCAIGKIHNYNNN